MDDRNQIYHAAPDQEIMISRGWNLSNHRKIKINNKGFRNDQNYIERNSDPLIAVVGDSYVEANQVDYANSFYGLLAREYQGQAAVYSFGFSGAALSQYLVWARHAVLEYGASYLVMPIISNDFDQSIGDYQRNEGFHQYEKCLDNDYCLELTHYSVGSFRRAIYSSALLRFLFMNVEVTTIPQKLQQRSAVKQYVNNAPAQVDPAHLADAELAVRLFFRDFPKYVSLPTSKVVFFVDGRRYTTSKVDYENSYFGKMRRYFIDQAAQNGYGVIDGLPVFDSHFERSGLLFESPTDAHWNELGHQVVAKELIEYFEQQYFE